jgi:hypothetical protein
MRLRIKKANDTSFRETYKTKYEDVLIDAINSLPEEFQKFDIMPSTSNRSNLIIYDYEKEKTIKRNDLIDEHKNFLELVNKELEKKDLIIPIDPEFKRLDSSFFSIITKEEYEELIIKMENQERQRLEKVKKEENKKQKTNSTIQNMIDEMTDQFGDFIIWQEPAFKEVRREIKPSFRYNRENPDFNDDVAAQIREYVYNLNVRVPDPDDEEEDFDIDLDDIDLDDDN